MFEKKDSNHIPTTNVLFDSNTIPSIEVLFDSSENVLSEFDFSSGFLDYRILTKYKIS